MLFGSKRVLVLDTSILIAILVEKDGCEKYVSILNQAKELLIGAPTLAEAGIVLQSRRGDGGLEAMEAHRRYGKGRHPAALNLGDCNSYATAKVAGATMIYKGNDFALTDLPPLLP